MSSENHTKGPFLTKEEQNQSFGKFIWNGSTKEFLGRTGTSWAKIGFFYLIFYIFLAGFMSLTLYVFYQTLEQGDDKFPTYIYSNTSWGSILYNPALGFRPKPRPENIESTLIWYKQGDNKDIEHWVTSLDKFIEPYKKNGKKRKEMEKNVEYIQCSEEKRPDPNASPRQVCIFNSDWLGPCNTKNKWGYVGQSPCIVLKMNKIINWEPIPYDDDDPLPEEMPESLQKHINESAAEFGNKRPKRIWISCKGENPADEEYLGDIKYYPEKWNGFPSFYFPFMNNAGYLSPVVAVQFEKPTENVLIQVECRAWARNILHNKKEKLGMFRFEFIID